MAILDGQSGQQHSSINDELDSLIGDIARQRGLEEDAATPTPREPNAADLEIAALAAQVANDKAKAAPASNPDPAEQAAADREARAAAAVAEAKRREDAKSEPISEEASTEAIAPDAELEDNIEAGEAEAEPTDDTDSAEEASFEDIAVSEVTDTRTEAPLDIEAGERSDIDEGAIEAEFEDTVEASDEAIEGASTEEEAPEETIDTEDEEETETLAGVTGPTLQISDVTESEADPLTPDETPSAHIIHLASARPERAPEPASEALQDGPFNDPFIKADPRPPLIDDTEPYTPPPLEERWDERRLLAPWLAAALPLAAVSTVALAASLSTLFARDTGPVDIPTTPGDDQLRLSDAALAPPTAPTPTVANTAPAPTGIEASQPPAPAPSVESAPTPPISASLQPDVSTPSGTRIAALTDTSQPETRPAAPLPEPSPAPQIKVAPPSPRATAPPAAKPAETASLSVDTRLPAPAPTPPAPDPKPVETATSIPGLTTPPQRSFDGPLLADSAGGRIAALLTATGVTLNEPETRGLATEVNALFDTASDGQAHTLDGWADRSIETAFAGTQMQVKDVVVERQANLTVLPDGLIITHDWLVTEADTTLYTDPSASDPDTEILIEADTLLDRMGLYVTPDGRTWNLVASEGVAAGYVSNQTVGLATKHEGNFAALYEAPPAPSVQQILAAETECRSATLSAGPDLTDSDTFCQTTTGNWVTPASTQASAEHPFPPPQAEEAPDEALLSIIFAHEAVLSGQSTSASWQSAEPVVRDLAERAVPDTAQSEMAGLINMDEGASLDQPDNAWTVSADSVAVRTLS